MDGNLEWIFTILFYPLMECILMKESSRMSYLDSEVTVESMKFASLEITSCGNIYPPQVF